MKIIVPLIIEQALAIAIGMIDTVMVASAGEAAVSGVSLVDAVNRLMIFVFSALAGGGAVVISQFLGRKDYKLANSAAKQLLWMVFIVACVVMLAVLAVRVPLLDLMFGNIEAAVMANARVYFLFTALSYPFLGVYNAAASIFRAMGNSRLSMVVSVVMNLLNVTGNAVLIFAFHMGAAGAAVATLIARAVGAVIMVIMVQDKNRPIYIERLFSFKPQLAIIRQICRIGIPNGMENGMFQFGKLITQSLVSSFGTVQIAANSVANSLTTLQYIPGNAIGLAMVIVVGRCIGAEEKEQAKKYTVGLLGVTYVLIFAISIILCTFSEELVGLFNLSAQSGEMAEKLLIFHSIFVSAIWPLAFTLPTAFRAASDVKNTMLLSVVSMWVFRVGLSFVLAKSFNMGVMGVWIAMVSDWGFRATCFVIRYVRGTWLTKYKAMAK